MARIAFDTGFLVKFLANDPQAKKLFTEAVLDERPVLPSPVLFELEVLFLRGKLRKEVWAKFREAIFEIANLCPFDKKASLQAAKFRHTFGLSSVDAMVVGVAVANRCRVLLTTDGVSLARRLKRAKLGLKVKLV